jgi:hypothetical protein
VCRELVRFPLGYLEDDSLVVSSITGVHRSRFVGQPQLFGHNFCDLIVVFADDTLECIQNKLENIVNVGGFGRKLRGIRRENISPGIVVL